MSECSVKRKHLNDMKYFAFSTEREREIEGRFERTLNELVGVIKIFILETQNS